MESKDIKGEDENEKTKLKLYPKHVVLDLDGTMVNEYGTSATDANITRPHLKSFLHFLFLDPRVASVRIWTNASRDWWNELNDTVIQPCLPNGAIFDEIWTVTDKPSKHFTTRYQAETGTYINIKSLKKYWRKGRKASLGMTRKNTIIIDNTGSTFKRNRGNGLYIKTYVGNQDDNELQRIQHLLNEDILNRSDVRFTL